MDPEKAQEEKEKKQHDGRGSPWRKSVVPLAFSLRSRSPTKREGIIDVIDEPGTEPTCQEKAHYPVFNPQDPRHNPSAEPRFWRRHDSQTSSSEAQKQASNWVQDLPRRSLHKARSGLLALRAGLMRRSTRHGSDSDDAPESPRAQEPHEGKHDHGEQRISDTSTQVDSKTGVQLYRTSTPWPSGPTEAGAEAPTHREMIEMIPTPEIPVRSDGLHDTHPAASYPVKVSPGESPEYCGDYDRALGRHTPKYFQTDGVGHRYTWEERAASISRHIGEGMHRSDDSAALQTTTASRGGANQRSEENAGPCGLCNSNRAFPGQQVQVPAIHGGGLVISEVCSSHGCRLSSHLGDTSDICSATDQDMMSTSTDSFSLLDPDMPSITGANRSNQQIANIRGSEALVTQERLQTYNETQSPETSTSSQPTDSSANVGIAFPGIYHELLEQWRKEIDRNPTRKFRRQGVPVNPQKSVSQISLQQALAMKPAASNGLSRYRGDHHQREDAHSPHCQQSRNAIFLYASGQPTVLSTEIRGNPRASQFMASASTRSPQGMEHSHPPTELATAHHSFGLHISLRNGTGDRERSRERSQRVSQQQPVHQQIPSNSQWLTSTVGFSPAFDDSTSSSSLAQNSIFSAPANSTSSTSNTAWSPLDSPIDEEVLFSPHCRDEYYIVDGKTSGFYPDRGDQPVKAICRRVDADGRLRSGPCMDWAPSNRVAPASELVIPARPSRPPQISVRGGTWRGRQTVDDYFRRFPVQSRRLG